MSFDGEIEVQQPHDKIRPRKSDLKDADDNASKVGDEHHSSNGSAGSDHSSSKDNASEDQSHDRDRRQKSGQHYFGQPLIWLNIIAISLFHVVALYCILTFPYVQRPLTFLWGWYI